MSEKTKRQSRRYRRGQGVIEYAGALIIAASIVAMAITVLPPNLAAFVRDIQGSILQYLLNHVPTA